MPLASHGRIASEPVLEVDHEPSEVGTLLRMVGRDWIAEFGCVGILLRDGASATLRARVLLAQCVLQPQRDEFSLDAIGIERRPAGDGILGEESLAKAIHEIDPQERNPVVCAAHSSPPLDGHHHVGPFALAAAAATAAA